MPLFNLQFLRKKLQAAITDLFKLLVPKAHNSECENLLFSLHIKPVRLKL